MLVKWTDAFVALINEWHGSECVLGRFSPHPLISSRLSIALNLCNRKESPRRIAEMARIAFRFRGKPALYCTRLC